LETCKLGRGRLAREFKTGKIGVYPGIIANPLTKRHIFQSHKMDKKTLTDEEALFVRGICRKVFERNSDLANDCFLYVWEKLHEENSRRIRTFKKEASFQTFLYSVTNRLVIDFRRTQFGYKVLPKYYWVFDEINRHIFRLFFYQKLSPEWAENAIGVEFKISREEAQARVDEVEKRIRESRVRMEAPEERQSVLLGEEVEVLRSEDSRANPEENIITREIERKRDEVLKVLKGKVEKLEAEDALIVRLYFERGLTAKEITGAIPGIKQKSVYKRIDRILKNLRGYLQETGVTEEDIKEIFESL